MYKTAIGCFISFLRFLAQRIFFCYTYIMPHIYNNIIDLTGHTPLAALKRIGVCRRFSAHVYAKLEYANPSGSVKDRAALFMLNEAEKSGAIREGSVLIEPTSGNTGIGLAAFAAYKGYSLILTMPENMSVERQKLLKAYGARIVLTDAALGMNGAIQKAKELALQTPHSFMPSQFTNPANALAHFETTGPELWEDSGGKIDIFVAGVGTGGTLSGTGRYLKSKKSSLRVCAVEPASSPVLSQGKAGKHGIQGIGAGFVPDTLDTAVYDEVIAVTDEQAVSAVKELARTEGIFAGISSGAALYAAFELAQKAENKDKFIVVLLPDGGERYLSCELFKELFDE